MKRKRESCFLSFSLSPLTLSRRKKILFFREKVVAPLNQRFQASGLRAIRDEATRQTAFLCEIRGSLNCESSKSILLQSTFDRRCGKRRLLQKKKRNIYQLLSLNSNHAFLTLRWKKTQLLATIAIVNCPRFVICRKFYALKLKILYGSAGSIKKVESFC